MARASLQAPSAAFPALAADTVDKSTDSATLSPKFVDRPPPSSPNTAVPPAPAGASAATSAGRGLVAEELAAPKLAYSIRNTFIDVSYPDAASDENPQTLSLPRGGRRSHMRCVSEPMTLTFLTRASDSPSMHSLLMEGGDDFRDQRMEIGSRLQAAMAGEVDRSTDQTEGGSSPSAAPRRHGHLRQLSRQTVDTIDEERVHSDEERLVTESGAAGGRSSSSTARLGAEDLVRPVGSPKIEAIGAAATANIPASSSILQPGEATLDHPRGLTAEVLDKSTASLPAALQSQRTEPPPTSSPDRPLLSQLVGPAPWADSRPPPPIAPGMVPAAGVSLPSLLHANLPRNTGAPLMHPGAWPPGAGDSRILAGQFAAWFTSQQLSSWSGFAEQTFRGVQPAPTAEALTTAYLCGFSAGATSTSATAPSAGSAAPPPNASAGYVANPTPSAAHSQAHRDICSKAAGGGSREGASKPKAAQGTRKPVACKWYARGTCRFGDTCRFNHPKEQRTSMTGQSDCTAGRPAAPEPQDASPPVAALKRQQQPPGEAQEEHPSSAYASNDADDAASDESDHDSRRFHCQLVWCDQRAFKEPSSERKLELEKTVQIPVKAHKTAEKCMRLLQKKKRSLEERGEVRPPSVFLVSWSNAPALVPYLSEVSREATKVVVLCDLCGPKGCESASRWSRHFPLVNAIAKTWEQGIGEVAKAVAALRLSTAS